MADFALISKRISLLLERSGLSTTAFAERIGASRSSISHILSGRNKPSLEIITSIAENFEAISLEYLIYGTDQVNETATIPTPSTPSAKENDPAEKSLITDKVKAQSQPDNKIPQPPDLKLGKNIKEVILIYDDGTFENFTK
jgi:transcriptional regulator with XRE-family HTH domain